MPDKTWLDYVTAVGSVTTPLVVLLLTAIGWRLKSRLERRAALEDKLREDRVVTYNEILEPFVVLFISDAAWKLDPKNKGRDKGTFALQQIASLQYRQQAFRLSVIGSDAVVRAYNNLMQFSYQNSGEPDDGAKSQTHAMMHLLGKFLLEIRRSVGNEATALDHLEMLEWFVTDARVLRQID